MDVVVDEVVAVLQVLAFGDTVGADQQIDFVRLVRQHHGFLFRARREQGEQFLKIVAALVGAAFDGGLRRTLAGDLGAVKSELGQQLWREVCVQVIGGVGKGGEDQHLLVAGVDGVFDLAEQLRLEVLQLSVVLRRDLAHRGQ